MNTRRHPRCKWWRCGVHARDAEGAVPALRRPKPGASALSMPRRLESAGIVAVRAPEHQAAGGAGSASHPEVQKPLIRTPGFSQSMMTLNGPNESKARLRIDNGHHVTRPKETSRQYHAFRSCSASSVPSTRSRISWKRRSRCSTPGLTGSQMSASPDADTDKSIHGRNRRHKTGWLLNSMEYVLAISRKYFDVVDQ